MTEAKKAQRWQDDAGTEWFVQRREAVRRLKAGWILRRVGYSLVAHSDAPEDPTPVQLQAWIDDHTKRKGGDSRGATARLWTDTRDGTEWEVSTEGGTLVFQREFESVRASRIDNYMPPRSMEDSELQEALDRGRKEE